MLFSLRTANECDFFFLFVLYKMLFCDNSRTRNIHATRENFADVVKVSAHTYKHNIINITHLISRENNKSGWSTVGINDNKVHQIFKFKNVVTISNNVCDITEQVYEKKKKKHLTIQLVFS